MWPAQETAPDDDSKENMSDHVWEEWMKWRYGNCNTGLSMQKNSQEHHMWDVALPFAIPGGSGWKRDIWASLAQIGGKNLMDEWMDIITISWSLIMFRESVLEEAKTYIISRVKL